MPLAIACHRPVCVRVLRNGGRAELGERRELKGEEAESQGKS